MCKGGAAASSGWEEWHKRNDSTIHAQDHQKQRRRRWHHLYNQMAQQITLNGRADETTAERRHQHDKAVAAASLSQQSSKQVDPRRLSRKQQSDSAPSAALPEPTDGEELVDADDMEDEELVDPRRLSRKQQSDSAPAAALPEPTQCLPSLPEPQAPTLLAPNEALQPATAVAALPTLQQSQCSQCSHSPVSENAARGKSTSWSAPRGDQYWLYRVNP